MDQAMDQSIESSSDNGASTDTIETSSSSYPLPASPQPLSSIASTENKINVDQNNVEHKLESGNSTSLAANVSNADSNNATKEIPTQQINKQEVINQQLLSKELLHKNDYNNTRNLNSNQQSLQTLTHDGICSSAVKNIDVTNVSVGSSNGLDLVRSSTCAIVTGNSAQMTPQQQSSPRKIINLNIKTTTGGNFTINVETSINVESLKKHIAKKLKLSKDRICLLYREKELLTGTLKQNNLMDGSNIIIIPNVETGLLAQRPENTVIQALESLNDTQVNDFLSGKTPLNLSMRLGDHMMLIQLQLSTIIPGRGNNHDHRNQGNGNSNNAQSANTSGGSGGILRLYPTFNNNNTHHHHHHHHHHHRHHHHHLHGLQRSATNIAPQANSSSMQPSAMNTEYRTAAKITQNVGDSGNVMTSCTGVTAQSAASALTEATPVFKKARNENKQNIDSDVTNRTTASSTSSATIYNNLDRKPSSLLKMTEQQQYFAGYSEKTDTVMNTNKLSSAITSPGVNLCSNDDSLASNHQTQMTINNTKTASKSVEPLLTGQSPITSLSNLVSCPIKSSAMTKMSSAATKLLVSSQPHQANVCGVPSTLTDVNAIKPANNVISNCHTNHTSGIVDGGISSSITANESSIGTNMCQDPIAAKLTSCLCKRLGGASSVVRESEIEANHSHQTTIENEGILKDVHPMAGTVSSSANITVSTNSDLAVSLSRHRTANNPISLRRNRLQQHNLSYLNNHYQSQERRNIQHLQQVQNYQGHNQVGTNNSCATNMTVKTALPEEVAITSSVTTVRPTKSASIRNQQQLTLAQQLQFRLEQQQRLYQEARYLQQKKKAEQGQQKWNLLQQQQQQLLQQSQQEQQVLKTSEQSVCKKANIPTICANPSSFCPTVSNRTALTSSSVASNSSNITVASMGTKPAIVDEEYDGNNGLNGISDSHNLAEASRNLTQTLRKLSKEVFTNRIDISTGNDGATITPTSTASPSNVGGSCGTIGGRGGENNSGHSTTRRNGTCGAIIESMRNHGRGIYSGTFSGTLNPALQDRYGRPKRDISTVIHILNDLLSATPQYTNGARLRLDSPVDYVRASGGSIGSSLSSATGNSMAASASASILTKKGNGNVIGSINANGGHSKSNKHLLKHHHHHHHHTQSCAKCLKAIKGSHSGSSHSLNVISSKLTNGKNVVVGSPTIHNSGQSINSSTTNTGINCIGGHQHHHHRHHHHHQNTALIDESKICQCRYDTQNESGEWKRQYICVKCSSEMDNLKTKTKMDQLRLVMQQCKQKREARKLRGAPYIPRTSTSNATSAVPATSTAITITTNENKTQLKGVSATASTEDGTGLEVPSTNSSLSASTTKTPAVLSSSSAVTSSSATTLSTVTASTASEVQGVRAENNSEENNSMEVDNNKGGSTPSSEVSPNHLAEEVDTAA